MKVASIVQCVVLTFGTVNINPLGAGMAEGHAPSTGQASLRTVQVVDLSQKFLDFYEAAVRTNATPDERWRLWKEKYDYAGVPPIPAGQQMAREQLDAAWTKYPGALERIRRGAAALTPSPQKRLDEVATLLGADQPVHIRLIAFVGAFHKNAFASGLKDGVSTISIPLEDSDQDHALAMTHEFTHAVQMQTGSWNGQSVASQIFAEGVAMRVTEHLNPGLPVTNYTAGSAEWMQRCEARLPQILAELNQHLGETGAEAVSRFTVGTGAASLGREVYCAGWHIVGKLLQDGTTFPELAHLMQDEADAKVTAAIKAMLDSYTHVGRSQAPRGEAPSDTFVIRNVRIFDGIQELPDDSVSIKDGVIVAVGKEFSGGPGVRVIDGSGDTVMPGLIDSHTHTYRYVGLQHALLFGVTTELGMEDPPRFAAPIQQEDAMGQHSDAADLFTAGWPAAAPGGHGTGGPVPTIGKPSDAQNFVDARIAEGSDYIKIIDEDGSAYGVQIPNISNETMAAVVAASHHRGKLAIAHIGSYREARDAVNAGVDGLAHLFVDQTPDVDFGAFVARHGVFVISTLTVLESLTAPSGISLTRDPHLKPYLTEDAIRNLKGQFPHPMFPPRPLRLANAFDAERELMHAGVPILAGTDSPNVGTWWGVSLHRELELLVQGGMSPAQALAAATSIPAKIFHLDDRGRIVPGMRADLVLVHGNPMGDISKTRVIVQIWKRGVAVDRKALLRTVQEDSSSTARALVPAGSKQGLISDFEDGTTTTRFGAGWITVTDDLYRGKSTAEMKVVDGGSEGSGKSLLITGQIRKGSPMPFAGVAFLASASGYDPANLSAFGALRFWAKGPGKLHVWIETATRPPTIQTLSVGNHWRWYTISFPTADVNGADITRVVFASTSHQGPFSFQLDTIALLPSNSGR
jgi:imidazolonepropionase-like amidohydrolase